MDKVSFALPIRSDKVEAGYRFIEELTGGRADEHHEVHKMRGLKNMSVFLQRKPTETVIVYLEGEGLDLDDRRKADHDFLKWFDAQVEDLTGHDWKYFESEQLMDWHHESGHRMKSGARG